MVREMQDLTCTRAELLAHKAKIKLAKQGRDLLEQKRTALMKELLRIADSVIYQTESLQKVASEARQALARADAIAGTQAVLSASLATRSELTLEISTANIMGVRVPRIEQKQIERSMVGRGYSIVGTSITIDEAAQAFENEVSVLLRLAEDELRLRRLADEIQRTARRVNALDELIIPRLEAEATYIQNTLDELEREDHFRLKLVKRNLARTQK